MQMKLFDKHPLFKEVTKLALPVAMGMAARTVMNLVDTAMVGRLGAASLAAAGLGGHISTLYVYSFASFNVGIQALAARRYGEKNEEQCGHVINGAIYFILLIGIIGTVLGYFIIPSVFPLLSSDPEVISLGKMYVAIRLLEFFPFAAIGVFRGFFDGVGDTKIYMKSMIIMNGLNIVLNYLLIFGKFGFPELGVKGAAIGSVVSTFAGVVVMLYYAVQHKYRDRYSLFHSLKPDLELMKRLYKLNFPQMMQVFLAYSGFLVFLKMHGLISTVVLAAGNICIAIMSLSYMPGYGIGIAAGTLLSQSLGANKPKLAENYGWEAVKLGIGFMGAMGLVFLFIPDAVMRIFTLDPEIIREGAIALRIIGLLQSIDACGMILGNCLQSAGMTKFVMLADVGINWFIFLPLTYVLAISFKMGIFGAWLALGVYMVIYGCTMLIAFAKGKWKKVKI